MKECDVCKSDMYSYDTGESLIGMEIRLTGVHPEIKKVLAAFGKTDFDICFCCWLKSLGVKPINEETT